MPNTGKKKKTKQIPCYKKYNIKPITEILLLFLILAASIQINLFTSKLFYLTIYRCQPLYIDYKRNLYI